MLRVFILLFIFQSCAFMNSDSDWEKRIELHKENLQVGKTFIFDNTGSHPYIELPTASLLYESKGYFPVYFDYVLTEEELEANGISVVDKFFNAYPSLLFISERKGKLTVIPGDKENFKRIVYKKNKKIISEEIQCKLSKLLKPMDYEEKTIEKILSSSIGTFSKYTKGLKLSQSRQKYNSCKNVDCRMEADLYLSIYKFYQNNYDMPLFECDFTDLN